MPTPPLPPHEIDARKQPIAARDRQTHAHPASAGDQGQVVAEGLHAAEAEGGGREGCRSSWGSAGGSLAGSVGASPVVGTVGLGAEEWDGKQKDIETKVNGVRLGATSRTHSTLLMEPTSDSIAGIVACHSFLSDWRLLFASVVYVKLNLSIMSSR